MAARAGHRTAGAVGSEGEEEAVNGQTKGSTQAHSALCRTIVAYLQVRRAWVYRVLGGVGSRAGVPDILAALPPSGRLICIDAKTGNARLHAGQERERVALEAAGALFIVCRQLEDVENALLAAGLVRERIIQGGRRG